MIPVTKSFLPPIEKYLEQIQRIYNNEWLTNRGELVRELEIKISDYLQLSNTNILCTSNGTISLQIALKVLGNNGEIITTPFSYVATTASIVWENCKPVFVDIHPENLTIDENKIKEAITTKTTCILATHVYGNPCNIEAISRISKQYNLKVIYDAAHCFGVKYKGKSIFEYGDISTCSFHATKIFHSGEGGALFCRDQDLFENMYSHHNFGHKGKEDYRGLGINAKMSELHAAMGLSMISKIDDIIEKRATLVDVYKTHLNFSKVKELNLIDGTKWNYSYYPVIFSSEKKVKEVIANLEKNLIFPRRYFYPSLNKLPYIKHKFDTPISNSIASRVICLPLYYDLPELNIIQICEIINDKT